MNSLEHLAEFESVLENYTPHPDAIKALEKLKLVLLVGPTSSGRNTIINHLLTTGAYHSIVSDTTRKPRENNGVLEQNGREYWFRPEQEILEDLQKGLFLEAAVIHQQQVSGISLRELQQVLADDKIAINEVQPDGAANVHKYSPANSTILFVLPPSFDEWMVRMTARGSLPEDEITRRLESAVTELETALGADYYTFVVNDTFKHTTKQIDEFVRQGVAIDQASARICAEELLQEVKAHLAI